MKTMYRLLFLFIPLLQVSCVKDYIPENKPVDIEVAVSYEDPEIGEKLSLTGTVFSIYDMNGKVVLSGELDGSGTIKIQQLAPNRYNIQATRLYDKNEYNRLLERNEDFDVNFSTTLMMVNVNPNQNTSFELKLISGSYAPLVIKQLYYAGSHTRDGASFRDQFMEIYNNSEEVQYADGLYIGEAFGALNENALYKYQQNSRQYDWTFSYEMPQDINANKDYIYTRTVLQLPGSGNDYPIAPGESIVVAATALNHQAPYTGSDGKQITVRDPSLTVDLSKADFEVHYASYLDPGKGLASDIDNPDVPNVLVHRLQGNDWIMSVAGQQSWIIFRADDMGKYSEWPKYGLPYVDGREVNRTTGYAQIPVSKILDAVELQSATSTKYPKKFSATNDSGEKFVESGQNSSNAIIRKTKEVKNGRRILEDTNNSTKDFVSIKAAPKAFVN